MPKCSYITYYQHHLLTFTSLLYTLMFSGSNIHNENFYNEQHITITSYQSSSLFFTLLFSDSNIHNEQKQHYHLLLILFFILYSHVLRFVMFPTARQQQQHCLPALTSNGPSSGRSEQCKAFFTMSSPQRALRLFGRSSLATSYKANVPILYVLLIFTLHPPYPSPPFFYSSSSTILFCIS